MYPLLTLGWLLRRRWLIDVDVAAGGVLRFAFSHRIRPVQPTSQLPQASMQRQRGPAAACFGGE